MVTAPYADPMESPPPRSAAVNESDMELRANNRDLDEMRATEPEFSLPPVDGGMAAWLFLFSAFVLEILVWGFPFAFGIFQEYYTSNPPFAGSRNIPIVGTCAMGLMYLLSPLISGFFAWYPNTRRRCIIIGLIIMCLSLGLSSLSQTVPHLIASQGVFYAIGGALCYVPVVAFMEQWFVKRKGLAFGIMWAGTGIGGIIIPLLLQYLLGKYGFRTTLRIWAAVLFAATIPLTLYLKPRLPISQATKHRKFNLRFLRNKSFLLFQLGNVLEGFGYFVPSIYLPTYARTLGASSPVAALTLIMINVAAVFGCIVMGIMKLLEGNEQGTDSMMVFSVLAAGRGIGNVACGPMSEALFRMGDVGGKGLYASEYGPLVLLTGISAALGGVSCFGRVLGWF
ncbi:unnamed protein product [Alternaria alternata]